MIGPFVKSTQGGIAAMTALLMTALMGTIGLSVELGYWYTIKGAMQSTADAAVVTAVMAYNGGNTANYANDAFAVAAQNGWSGTNKTNNQCLPTSGVLVCVNSPPQYGNYTASTTAIEVVISEQVPPMLAWAVGYSSQTGILAHAVMSLGTTGNGCLLSLGTGNSISIQGNGDLTLSGCDADGHGNISFSGNHSAMKVRSFNISGTVSAPSQLTVTGPAGKSNSTNPPADPFASRSIGTKPATCTTLSSIPATLSPGAYCGLNITSSVTLSTGIYYIEGGTFSVSGAPGTTVTSASGGVTIVLTNQGSGAYATASITGNGVLNLTALTSGPTAGLVFYGDPANTTNSTETFAGNGTNKLTGAIYFPGQTVSLSGNGTFSSPNNCFEIVALDVQDSGNGTLSDGCIGDGLTPIGTTPVALVE